MIKPGWDEYFMDMARLVAVRGTCDRLRVGAIITLDHHVLATGYNGAPAGWADCSEVGHELVQMGERDSCVRTIHAEENAILQCAMYGSRVIGATLYTTAAPCLDCAKRIAQVGVKRVVFATRYDSARSGSVDVIGRMLQSGVEMVHLP